MLRLPKKKKDTQDPPGKQQAVILPMHSPNRSLDFLVELIGKIRPDNAKDIEQAELRFKALLYQVSQEKTSLFSLRKALLTQFLRTNIVIALSENGIVSSRGLVQELMGKIKHKILPELQSPDNFLYVINKIFYKKSDHIWVEGIDKDLWKQFFEGLGIQINLTEPRLISQLQRALQLLSYRITTLGLEKEITHRYENLEDAVYPFLEQNRLVNEYLYQAKPANNEPAQRILLANINEALHNCNQSIQWIKEQRVINAGGDALVTTWGYYEQSANPADPKPPGYGQIKFRKDPGGYWETYTYDANGALIQTVSQYGNSSFGDGANSKVENLTRATANPVQTHVTLIKGQEVARSYVAEYDETSTTQEFERRYITCVTPGASWTAADNLVSTTRSYTSNNSDPAKRGSARPGDRHVSIR